MMKTSVVTLPSCRIAYIRKTGPYGVGNYSAMETLKAWANGKGLLDRDAVILGIAQDDPAVAKAEECRYDTGIVISGEHVMDDPCVELGDVAGGKYLVLDVDHTAEALQTAWGDLDVELERGGCRMDPSRPVMERYAARNLAEHRCEICIPVC